MCGLWASPMALSSAKLLPVRESPKMIQQTEIFSQSGGITKIPPAPRCLRRRMLLLAGALIVILAQSVTQILPDEMDNAHAIDSLQLRLLDVEIRKAKLRVGQTGFWHRLIPRIQFSAGYGVKDLFFVDPSNSYLFPKDAYRLTVSISITDIFDFAKHSDALLDLAKIETEYERVRRQQELSKLAAQHQNRIFDELAAVLNDELNIRKDIAAFDQLRFNQGKLGYDAMLNAKLDLLEMRKQLLHLAQQKIQVKK